MRYDEPRHVLTSEEHGSRHPTRRRRCLWRWWRGGGRVGIGVGGDLGRAVRMGDWQEASPRSGFRVSRDWRCESACVCVCVVFIGADC